MRSKGHGESLLAVAGDQMLRVGLRCVSVARGMHSVNFVSGWSRLGGCRRFRHSGHEIRRIFTFFVGCHVSVRYRLACAPLLSIDKSRVLPRSNSTSLPPRYPILSFSDVLNILHGISFPTFSAACLSTLIFSHTSAIYQASVIPLHPIQKHITSALTWPLISILCDIKSSIFSLRVSIRAADLFRRSRLGTK